MRELILAYNCFLEDDDVPEFDHVVVVWREDGEYYRVEHPEQDYDLDKLSAEPIPMHHYRCLWFDGLTVAPNPSSLNCYIKVPRLHGYDGTSIVSQLLLGEVQIMERLKTTPHINLCTYYGCVRDGTFVVGLCLKRYQRTLDEAMEDADFHIDQTKVMSGIRSGLDFLHSLDLAHNDLNPSNVMLDDDCTPVIIDFDDCSPVGSVRKKSGTVMWSQDTAISSKETDNDSFKLIERYIKGEYFPDDF